MGLIKLECIRNGNDYGPNERITYQYDGAVVIDEHLEAFSNFLKAMGYFLDNKSLEVVDDSSESYDDICNSVERQVTIDILDRLNKCATLESMLNELDRIREGMLKEKDLF